jgi:hypothetical protein
MHALVENEIKSKMGDIGVYKTVFAHSGAIIGSNNNRTQPAIQGDFGGEVNDPYPTIREQVLAGVRNGATSDETVDLVLLDGGINDVGVANILNPKSEIDQPLDQRIDLACHRYMKELLKLTAEKYPRAKIIVTGYYQIISEDTFTDLEELVVTTLLLTAFGIVGNVVGLLAGAAEDEIKKRCLNFKDRSHTKIQLAIAETMNELPMSSGRISFADPGFLAENSALASNALIFGIGTDLSPQDNDVIAEERRLVCERNTPERGDKNTCAIASVGHPNPKGAEKYASAVISQLQAASVI